MPNQAFPSTAVSVNAPPLFFLQFQASLFQYFILIVDQVNEVHLISRQFMTAFLDHHDSVDTHVMSGLVRHS